MTKEDEARHQYLTGNVITQEFTTNSIKAVRLADRIIEWFNGQTSSLKAENEELIKQNELLNGGAYVENIELKAEVNFWKSDSITAHKTKDEFKKWCNELELKVESLQSQLAESQKRENVMAKIADRAQDINEELLAKCNKAELDKQELLNLISRLNDYFFCEKTLDEWEYEDLMNSTHKAIITHA